MRGTAAEIRDVSFLILIDISLTLFPPEIFLAGSIHYPEHWLNPSHVRLSKQQAREFVTPLEAAASGSAGQGRRHGRHDDG
jgi:hypothetical protein